MSVAELMRVDIAVGAEFFPRSLIALIPVILTIFGSGVRLVLFRSIVAVDTSC